MDRYMLRLKGWTWILKLIISLISLLTLWFWISNVWTEVFAYWRAGGDPLPAYYIYFIVLPVVYLMFSLLSCTELLRWRALLIAGVLMHVALAAWIIIDITHPSFVTKQTVAISIMFSILWVLLFLARRSQNGMLGRRE